MIRNNFPPARFAGFAAGVILLGAMTGCAGTPIWGGWSTQPTVAQLQKVRGIQADWVYYPAYGVYYSRNFQEYVYWDATDWFTRLELIAPLTPEKLQASPAVRMDFQDAPALHHAAVARRYPRNWTSPMAALAANGR